MPTNVEVARQQWAEGYRRINQLARSPGAGEPVFGQVEALVEELRQRIGSTYTVEELAESYHGADRWAYDTLADRAVAPGWAATATAALDAAYHLYARGARDYSP